MSDANQDREVVELLRVTIHEFHELRKEIRMALIDIDNALATTDLDLTALKTDNDAILAKLQSGPQNDDTTAQVKHIQNINALIEALTAAQSNALNPPTPPAPPTPANPGTPGPSGGATPAPTTGSGTIGS